MKKIYTILALLLAAACSYSQAPQSFNYQAIVRASSGQEIVSQTVGVQISLLQYTAEGTAVYVERFSPTTNDYGLVNIVIGTGDVQIGTFSTIDWGDGPYFLKVEVDENGADSYIDVGTSQLLSVPYALHAKTVTETDPTWSGAAVIADNIGRTGNVGVGTTNPQYPLHIISKAASGPETLFQSSVADDPNSYFEIRNVTSINGKFIPSLISHNGTDHRQSLFIVGKSTDEFDDNGGFPLITFDARRMEGQIINRPLFQWSNYGDIKMTMLANGNVGIGVTDPGNFGLSVNESKDVRLGHYINIADYDHEEPDAQIISRDGNLHIWTGGLFVGRASNGGPAFGYGNLVTEKSALIGDNLTVGDNVTVNGTTELKGDVTHTGTTQIGSTGVKIVEIREFTGTTSGGSSTYTNLPVGWTIDNTRILSTEYYDESHSLWEREASSEIASGLWDGSYYLVHRINERSSVLILDNGVHKIRIYDYYTTGGTRYYSNRPYRIIAMRVE